MRQKTTASTAFIFSILLLSITRVHAADLISQKNWLSQYEGFFASSVCEKKEYVSTCLKSSISECKLSVREQLTACTKSVGLPAKIQIGHDSELWGEKMGGCLAPKLVSKSVSPKKGDAKCNDLSAW